MLDAMASYRNLDIQNKVNAPPSHFERDGELPAIENLSFFGFSVLQRLSEQPQNGEGTTPPRFFRLKSSLRPQRQMELLMDASQMAREALALALAEHSCLKIQAEIGYSPEREAVGSASKSLANAAPKYPYVPERS